MEKEILQTVKLLAKARVSELTQGFESAKAEAQVTAIEIQIEARKRAVEADAFESGSIDGKNLEMRKAQVYQHIRMDAMIRDLDEKLEIARNDLVQKCRSVDLQRVGRRYLEDLFSAQRAIINAAVPMVFPVDN